MATLAHKVVAYTLHVQVERCLGAGQLLLAVQVFQTPDSSQQLLKCQIGFVRLGGNERQGQCGSSTSAHFVFFEHFFLLLFEVLDLQAHLLHRVFVVGIVVFESIDHT